MYRTYRCCLHLYDLQLPKQTSQNDWSKRCRYHRTLQKNKMFSSNFSSCSSIQKPIILAPFLPPLIRTQESVKLQKHVKLRLKSTLCLSQSLPQSSNSKSWGGLSGPKNDVNCNVLWTCRAFYLQKRCPPQLLTSNEDGKFAVHARTHYCSKNQNL